MRLAFIVCPPYHGSTLLHLLLNNHSRISALGDTNPSREYDQICACRKKVSECEYWRSVSKELRTERFANLKLLLPILPSPLRNYRIEGRALPVSPSAALNRAVGRAAAAALDLGLPLLWRPGSRRLAEYFETYLSFYEYVLGRHGTAVIVDGSKSARKVALFARRAGGGDDVRALHLVRDPRGFAASWRSNGDGSNVGAAAWLWRDVNGRYESLENVLPYRRVRYEDLASRPAEALRGVLDFLGVEQEELIGSPRCPDKHHLMGNRALFAFDGTIRLDERWRERLSPAEQQLVLRHAGARAARYGYGADPDGR